MLNRRQALQMLVASSLAAGPMGDLVAAVKTGTSQPDVRSNAVLVLDGTDRSVIFARRADTPQPIASITKLMTALVVLEARQPLDEILRVEAEDRALRKGAASRLTAGTKLRRGDLMCLALMSSENRAARTLGRNYPGGEAACVRAMNARARSLGMMHSTFADPAGLSSRNMATATDLSRLVIAASKNARIREYSTCQSHDVRVGKALLEFRNTNTLVRNADWSITVQKTGYLQEAGRCLVMQAMVKGRPVVFVLLDSYGKNTRTADARRIRRWMEARAAV
jgi:D-alanyl-D-alanine endopeptidase (penicillin-binding protein 7)